MDPFARRFMWSVIDDVAEKRKKSVVVLTTHSMEEGEALCSKIAIQVDGQFCCFGSVQQVKGTYGTGYEVPVKFKPVSAEARVAFAGVFRTVGLAGHAEDYVLSLAEAERALELIGDKEKAERAKSDGAPFSQDAQQVNCNVFCDWWILDTKVRKLMVYLQQRSGSKAQVLEHHGLSVRFRLPQLGDASRLTALFEGLLTDHPDMDDFAVIQSSLEQVFNDFARKAGHTIESA